MQHITKLKLAAVHQICDAQEKSTEYMLQFMQDACKVSLEEVLFYMDLGVRDKKKLFKELNSLVKVMMIIEETF